MTTDQIPKEFKDKFQLLFIGQRLSNVGITDPRIKDWVAGRMEIRKYEDIHGNNMEHYYTPNSDEWKHFCNTYNGKWIDQPELNEVINTLKTEFYKLDENHNPIF